MPQRAPHTVYCAVAPHPSPMLQLHDLVVDSPYTCMQLKYAPLHAIWQAGCQAETGAAPKQMMMKRSRIGSGTGRERKLDERLVVGVAVVMVQAGWMCCASKNPGHRCAGYIYRGLPSRDGLCGLRLIADERWCAARGRVRAVPSCLAWTRAYRWVAGDLSRMRDRCD